MIENVKEIYQKVRAFEKEAHEILGHHEAAPSRIILLEHTYSELSGLSLKQDELFRQALRCIESRLFRAAHVMAWAGFMDFLEETLASDGFTKLKKVRPKWNVNSIEDLRENYPEFQLIEVCQDVGLCTRNEKKALLGLLNKRNECAHPGDYFPGLNESLGYISELFERINALKGKLGVT
jgi:hypothetical protein